MKQSDDSYLARVNVRSSVSRCEQIENQILFAIASGRLKAGDKLPALMPLAKRLGTKTNTAMTALSKRIGFHIPLDRFGFSPVRS